MWRTSWPPWSLERSWLLWRFGETGERRFLYAASILGGTALAIKLGGLAYLAAIYPSPHGSAAPTADGSARGRRSRSGIAVVLLLAAALPTYVIAWRMTGNPIFPFLNQKFPSPLVDHAA